MNVKTFWSVIEHGKNSGEPEDILEQHLSVQSAEDLIAFQEIFDRLFNEAYKWDLWGAAYLIGGGCSDDGFIDFRYGLISKGQEVYERALTTADSLSTLGDDVEIENELFGYVAQEIYENKASKEMPRKTSAAPADPLGEEWDFDDQVENSKRLPRLFTMHQ